MGTWGEFQTGLVLPAFVVSLRPIRSNEKDR